MSEFTFAWIYYAAKGERSTAKALVALQKTGVVVLMMKIAPSRTLLYPRRGVAMSSSFLWHAVGADSAAHRIRFSGTRNQNQQTLSSMIAVYCSRSGGFVMFRGIIRRFGVNAITTTILTEISLFMHS